MPETTGGRKQVFEFEHISNARSRAIADDEETAREMVAETSQCDEDDFELLTTYEPGEEPSDDVTTTGHPFQHGDRISLELPNSKLDLEMTVQYRDDTLRFTEETAPFGIKNVANSDFNEEGHPSWHVYRAENALQRLYKNGWRQVKDE